MALETLKGVGSIGSAKIGRCDEGTGIPIPQYLSDKERPIWVDDKANIIAFKIQNGPVKEAGVNGCQVDTLIQAALHIIKKLDEKFPCKENKACIGHLSGAIGALQQRKQDRQKRGVEGTNKA